MSLLGLKQEALDVLRAPFIQALGQQSFEAPNQVGLYLFEDKSWVIMNFNDNPVVAKLNGETHDVAARQWLCHWSNKRQDE